MTEQEWLECTDPEPMLVFLGEKAGKRKLMLFASACCYRVWDLLPRKENRQVVAMLDLYADGLADCDDLHASALRADRVSRQIKHPAKQHAARATSALCLIGTMRDHLWKAGIVATHARNARLPAVEAESGVQCRLLRDIFGNPFRPITADPAWLSSTVVSLATAIYTDRAFDRLPILADALEDAGCDNPDILNHCRQPGEHVRGCWPVDLLLGKQ